MRTVSGRADRVVIVGAGLGGLACALHLAGAGRQVTVVEREPLPGGRAGRLRRDGYQFDTGPAVNLLRLAAAGEKHGVRFRYRTTVSHVDTARGRATGVVTEAGERIPADVVVLNPDLPIAYRDLLQDWRDGLAQRYADELVGTLERRGYVGFGAGIEVLHVVTPADWAAAGMAAGTPFSAAHTLARTGPFRPRNLHKALSNVVFVGSGTPARRRRADGADLRKAGRAADHGRPPRNLAGSWMSTPEFDAVIAGGGLSGLSLAARLATNGWRDRRVLVIDDVATKPKAVCWGFWSTGPGLLDAAVSRTYQQVRVHAAGHARVLPLGRYRYRVVRRADLSRVVLGLLDGCPGYAVLPGHVQHLRDGAGVAETIVDGRLIRSRWAFDSVSPKPDAGIDARLAFTGWEVRCEHPAFDPQTPVLFDFRTPQAGGARFVYVLPEDRHQALVELTEFVPRHARPPTGATRSAALAGYLRDVLHSGAYTILRTESVVLPLRIRPPRRGTRHILTIGARGGLIKASTGYAYQRIQRDSAAIAASLARRGHPFDLPRPGARHRLLDTVLLEVLDRDPAHLEQAFDRLFAANPTERVLRFLDEDTGVPDELRLIASLPPAPYLRALATHCFHAS
jgi:lycopene beta-cyclase